MRFFLKKKGYAHFTFDIRFIYLTHLIVMVAVMMVAAIVRFVEKIDKNKMRISQVHDCDYENDKVLYHRYFKSNKKCMRAEAKLDRYTHSPPLIIINRTKYI